MTADKALRILLDLGFKSFTEALIISDGVRDRDERDKLVLLLRKHNWPTRK